MTLSEVLKEARELGLLGKGPIEAHVSHAEGFARAFIERPSRVLDLGSGGGIPGLVLARAWVGSNFTLLDSTRRSSEFLSLAVDRLGIDDRVAVLTGRAEILGRDQRLRGYFDAVVARSFGPPAVVSECASPFLEPGGLLVVSEPPDELAGRWPAGPLGSLGLADDGAMSGYPRLRRLLQIEPCPDRFPRRTGVPAKRPLW